MTTDAKPGVLLKGEDGTHYFIPKTDLSAYVVQDVPEALTSGDDVASNVPRLHAFAVSHSGGAAFIPAPEGGPPRGKQP